MQRTKSRTAQRYLTVGLIFLILGMVMQCIISIGKHEWFLVLGSLIAVALFCIGFINRSKIF